MTKDIHQLDKLLYKYWYWVPREKEVESIWNNILNDVELQKEAIQIIKDVNGLNTVKAPTICHRILMYKENINEEVYQELIKEIYSHIDIARIAIEGDCILGGISYLILSLKNPNLKLTEEQKTFAVNEALNRSDTKKSYQERIAFEQELDNNHIYDTQPDPSRPIINERKKLELRYCMCKIANKSRIHGISPFDIRYYILKNPNWTDEEKKALINEFWYSDAIFQDYLNAWEENIIDSIYTFTNLCEDETTKEELLSLEYEDLLNLTNNKETISLLIVGDLKALKEIYKLRDGNKQLSLKPKNE